VGGGAGGGGAAAAGGGGGGGGRPGNRDPQAALGRGSRGSAWIEGAVGAPYGPRCIRRGEGAAPRRVWHVSSTPPHRVGPPLRSAGSPLWACPRRGAHVSRHQDRLPAPLGGAQAAMGLHVLPLHLEDKFYRLVERAVNWPLIGVFFQLFDDRVPLWSRIPIVNLISPGEPAPGGNLQLDCPPPRALPAAPSTPGALNGCFSASVALACRLVFARAPDSHRTPEQPAL